MKILDLAFKAFMFFAGVFWAMHPTNTILHFCILCAWAVILLAARDYLELHLSNKYMKALQIYSYLCLGFLPFMKGVFISALCCLTYKVFF